MYYLVIKCLILLRSYEEFLMIKFTIFIQVIIVDKNQFRPSSLWSRTYLPKTVTDNHILVERGVTFLYVSEADAKYLEEIDNVGGTVWVTTKDNIPDPIWKCEMECITDPVIG